ncbi:o-succinylbenzoate synthase [Microcoleus sp. FACHB-672]|uniref:o-succinylbenzoate synthase n=1 Tax=Microcoleus sp. FACHB-672 TaxID=2692825 RepID=UPI0016832094|nr:o-succinylbenzoate synthase [Microcoleus sp. FACHB-672]MBD2039574.1 o-succinylbenzoate synthase [Microcoleus sp. FACHB-672]
MRYQFEFRPYRHPFKKSLHTSHGIWEVREGIIIRLIAATGEVGFGEIAPLSWFGSESVSQALNFCKELLAEISPETILSIPAKLPACQFGFESAMEAIITSPQISKSQQLNPLSYSGLLPAGKKALSIWQALWHQGYRTFKWKIGVADIQEELKLFQQLIQALPVSAKVRLDANGGLNWEQANQWLQACDQSGVVEFLEQPLAVNQFEGMLKLSNQYSTQLALDESVATITQMQGCYQRGWGGIFVIKPAIAGFPSQLRKFHQEYKIDAVFSSVFETAIGRKFALQLSAELQTSRAVGFGVNHWFAEGNETCCEQLWNSL